MVPQPFTRPLPVTTPEETNETSPPSAAGQTVPSPVIVAYPYPSPPVWLLDCLLRQRFFHSQPMIIPVPVNLPV